MTTTTVTQWHKDNDYDTTMTTTLNDNDDATQSDDVTTRQL